jgi:hypothetical protein
MKFFLKHHQILTSNRLPPFVYIAINNNRRCHQHDYVFIMWYKVGMKNLYQQSTSERKFLKSINIFYETQKHMVFNKVQKPM